VITPNSTENAPRNDFCSLKIIQPAEKNPSQQHKSAKQVFSQAHLMQLRASLVEPGVLETEHIYYLN